MTERNGKLPRARVPSITPRRAEPHFLPAASNFTSASAKRRPTSSVPAVSKCAVLAIAAKDPRCAYVDTAGATIANTAHFDTAGTLDVGRRFAEALVKFEAAGRK